MAELTPSAQSDDAARRRTASLIGRVISQRYRIDEVIAMGGMGAVYRGEHVRMRKRVAIKILHPDTEGLPELVKRFEREAVAGAHIQHPNVATATDFGETDDGLFYLISEYVRGVTLYEIIRRGPLAPARAAHIARQLAAALAAVHAIDIVHRDLKPRNVMIVEGQNDLVKLIDFGFAKVRMERLSLVSAEMDGSERHSVAERLTSAGVVFGTMSYLAPEAAFGMDAVDARSDLFALGIMLYEMLAGQHPFSADDPVQLFTKMSTLSPPPISERSPGVVVPPELEAVVQRLIKKFPEERFQTADELLEALEEACESAALSLPVPAATSTRPPPGASAKTPSMPPPPAVPKLDDEGEASPAPAPTPVPAPPAVEEAAPEASAAAPETSAAAPETSAAAPGTSVSAPGTSVSALELDVAAPEASAASSGADEEGAGPDQEAPARPKKKKRRKKKTAEAQEEAPAEAAAAEPEEAPPPAKAAPPEPRRSLGPWLIGVALAAGVGVLIARSGDAPPVPAAPPRPSAAATVAAPPSPSAAVIPASARPEPAAPPRPPAPPASAAPPPAPKGEPDPETREALRKAVKGKAWNGAADALLKLAARDRGALEDRVVAEAARSLAIAIASPAGKARVDAVYQALATRFGAAGPALLYDLVEGRGRSGPALHAAEMLRKPEVAALATPALRVSFVLRDAPCDKKLDHLDEAVQDGDARTLLVLETVVRPCFGQNHSVFEATQKLKQRLKGQ